MTSTNCFGFNGCGPIPTGYGFNSPIGLGHTGYGLGAGPIGWGLNNPMGYGFNNPTGYGFSNGSNSLGFNGNTGYGFNSPIGFVPTNYGFGGPSGCVPTGCFTPGFSGQHPINTLSPWSINSGFGGPINGTSFNTPWLGQNIGGYTPPFTLPGWNNSTIWNSGNTFSGSGDSRFFSGGYNPFVSYGSNSTPWNGFGSSDTGSYGYNPISNSVAPLGWTNNSWQSIPSFNISNSLQGYSPLGIGASTTGLPFGSTGGWNTTPWSGFVNPTNSILGGLFGQVPFSGIPFNSTPILGGHSPVGFNGSFNGQGVFNGQSLFNGYSSGFGQGYSTSPFGVNGTFVNSPFTNSGSIPSNFVPNYGSNYSPNYGHGFGPNSQYGDRSTHPVTNGTIGLNREAA